MEQKVVTSEKSLDTIVERLRKWGVESPNKIAVRYCDGDGNVKASLSYETLNKLTYKISIELIAHYHIKQGDCVMLVYPPCIDFNIIFLSCIRAGIIPVPVYPPNPKGIKKNVHLFSGTQSNCKAKVALCNGEYMTVKKVTDMKGFFTRTGAQWPEMEWIVTDSLLSEKSLPNVPDDEPGLHFEGDRLCFLQYTSGSTSVPKGVMITNNAVLHDIDNILFSLQADQSTCVVSWLPQYHDMGLIGSFLSCIYCGGNGVYFSPISFVLKPCLWLVLITKYKATHIQGPNFCYAFLLRRFADFSNKTMIDLSSVRHIFNAAEPIAVETAKQFIRTMSVYGLRREVMIGGYGLAESCVYVCDGGRNVICVKKNELEQNDIVVPVLLYDVVRDDYVVVNDESDENTTGQEKKEGDTAQEKEEEVIKRKSEMLDGNCIKRADYSQFYSCGNVKQCVNTKIIITKEGKDVGECKVGEIYISSPCLAAGYYPDNVTSFHKKVEGQTDDFLETGDLGFIFISFLPHTFCRSKDLIILHGKNHYPQDIEYSCYRVPQVKQGSIAAFAIVDSSEEKLIVVMELRDGKYSDDDYADILRKVSESISMDNGVTPYSIIIVEPRTIPKTTSGKITRNAVKQEYLNNALKVLFSSSWSDDDENASLYDDEVGVETESNHPLEIELNGVTAIKRKNELSILPTVEEEKKEEKHTEVTLPSQLDGVNTLLLHDEELESVLLEDICSLCGIQSYTVTISLPVRSFERYTTDSLEMMNLDSLRRAQLKSILEEYYGAKVEDAFIFDVNTTFNQLFDVINSQKDREPILHTISMEIEGENGEVVQQNVQQMSVVYKPPERTCCQKFCCLIR